MAKRYFEFSEGSSNKFWEVWLEGSKVLTRYGKIGASGQTTVKNEGSPAGAQKLHDKLVREKTRKGYAEKGGSPAPAVAPKAAAPKAAAVPKAVKVAPAPAAPAAVEPGFRRFEFAEGSSNKFWEVKVEGEQQIIRFGKIGTAGQSKDKDFESASEAKADTKKLITEKTGKGYVEVGGAPKLPSNPALEAAIAKNPDDLKNWRVFVDWLLENGVAWAEVMTAAVQGKPDKKKQNEAQKEMLGEVEGTITWANGVISRLDLQPQDGEEGAMEEALERVLSHPAGHFIRSMTLGLPPHEDLAWHLEGLAEAISNAGPLPFMETLDLSPDASHMDQPSWRRVGAIGDVWKAAPHLKALLLQGSNGSDDGKAIDFGDIEAPNLEKLVFISGVLNKAAPLSIGKAKLPALTHLELYFGTEDYGCTSEVSSLKGILEGSGLPALKTLGLKNSEWKAPLIEAVANSKILPRLSEVDFGLGVMGFEEGEVLIKHAPKFKHLKKLVLHDNYFEPSDLAALKKALPNVVPGTQREGEIDDRYTSIAE